MRLPHTILPIAHPPKIATYVAFSLDSVRKVRGCLTLSSSISSRRTASIRALGAGQHRSTRITVLEQMLGLVRCIHIANGFKSQIKVVCQHSYTAIMAGTETWPLHVSNVIPFNVICICSDETQHSIGQQHFVSRNHQVVKHPRKFDLES